MPTTQTGFKITVVESNPQLQSVLGNILDHNFNSIQGMESASQCLQSVQDNLYLVDLMLEDMDGLSLIEEIRAQKPRVPIIAFINTQPSGQFELIERSLKQWTDNPGITLSSD